MGCTVAPKFSNEKLLNSCRPSGLKPESKWTPYHIVFDSSATHQRHWRNVYCVKVSNLINNLPFVLEKSVYNWLHVFIMMYTRLEWIYTKWFPECQGTPCTKQVRQLKFKSLKQDLNPHQFSSWTRTQPFYHLT